MCDAPESTIVIFSLISLLGGIFIGWILKPVQKSQKYMHIDVDI